MKLDHLTQEQLEMYAYWEGGDDVGGDYELVGYVWTGFKSQTGGTILLEDDQGFVDVTVYDHPSTYAAQVELLRKAEEEAFEREAIEWNNP
jgi:hypothetical protein